MKSGMALNMAKAYSSAVMALMAKWRSAAASLEHRYVGSGKARQHRGGIAGMAGESIGSGS
jgi:hypothetical protein